MLTGTQDFFPRAINFRTLFGADHGIGLAALSPALRALAQFAQALFGCFQTLSQFPFRLTETGFGIAANIIHQLKRAQRLAP